jgi:cyclohexanone monooxygenase
MSTIERAPLALALDMVIVGAGFAGLYMLHKARGLGLSAKVIEAAGGVGGTWYWNRYPGARCDFESLQYGYSFSEELQQEWSWSERYAPQPEIRAYLDHVADRFDLRRDLVLGTKVEAAHYDEARRQWSVATDRGDALSAKVLVMATGCLSETLAPKFPGLEHFRGKVYHTGRWPHERVDFSGLRVGQIGTGSSGVQIAPMIAAEAERLTVFQRTANYVIPAGNGPMDRAREAEWKAHYAEKRRAARDTGSAALYNLGDRKALDVSPQQRRETYERRWADGGVNFSRAFTDVTTDLAANTTAADFVRSKIREIVRDPKTAEALCPNDHALGARRLCIGTDYFETFNRDNVALVNLREQPIVEFTETGLKTTAGQYPLDALVLATGFDAVTGALLRVDIRGRGGARLADAWGDGPRTYLGVATAGFPNLFFITGPGSPSVLTNVVIAIEQHVEFVSGIVDYMRGVGAAEVEAEPDAQADWTGRVVAASGSGIRASAESWYLGANVPGKPRMILPYCGGFNVYERKCEAVAAAGYSGFRFAP